MIELLSELPPVDIETWAAEALEVAVIEAAREEDREAIIDFATSLGKLAFKGGLVDWDDAGDDETAVL